MEITDASVQVLLNVFDKLGIAAEHVYSVYVQAQAIIAIGTLAAWSAGILTFVVATVLLRNIFVRPGVMVREPDEGDKLLALFIAMICGFLMAIIIGFVVYQIFMAVVLPMMCPEYTAIQALFGNMMSVVQTVT